jgi:hypothetical protein
MSNKNKIKDNESSLFHSAFVFLNDLLAFSSIVPYGLVVRIPAFHAGGPGSIPGVGKFFFFLNSLFCFSCITGKMRIFQVSNL